MANKNIVLSGQKRKLDEKDYDDHAEPDPCYQERLFKSITDHAASCKYVICDFLRGLCKSERCLNGSRLEVENFVISASPHERRAYYYYEKYGKHDEEVLDQEKVHENNYMSVKLYIVSEGDESLHAELTYITFVLQQMNVHNLSVKVNDTFVS